MARILSFLVASFVAAAVTAPMSLAQEAALPAPQTAVPGGQEPRPLVTVMVTSADEFLNDLKFLMGEGPDAEKALENLEVLLLDPYLEGLNKDKPPMPRDKPSGAVVYLENDTLQSVLMFPVSHPGEFFDVISDVGVESAKESDEFYAISGDIYQGYARVTNGYVYMAESKELLLRGLPQPEELFKDFLDKKYDVAAVIDGTSSTTEQRRTAFEKFRKETTASLEKMKEESELDFKIRKAMIEFQLDEIERFFSESKHIELGWVTDVNAKQGLAHVELEALPDTSLAKTIEVLEQTDGNANTSMPGDYVSYGSSHFLFDEMRQTHMLALSDLLRQKAHEEIASDKQIADKDKENANKVADLLFDLMNANTQDGTLFGWLKVLKNEKSQHTLLGTTTVKDVPKVVTVLTDGGVGEMNIESIDEKADIHKVQLYGDYSGLKGQFGDDLALYFVTGKGDLKDRLWIGMGHNAIDELKKAVAANEQAGPVAAQLRIKVGSWVDALVAEESKKPEEEPKESTRRIRRRSRRRVKKEEYDVGRVAWQTLANAEDDILVLTLEKVGENRVVVHEDVDTGLLRFIGKVLAHEINASF